MGQYGWGMWLYDIVYSWVKVCPWLNVYKSGNRPALTQRYIHVSLAVTLICKECVLYQSFFDCFQKKLRSIVWPKQQQAAVFLLAVKLVADYPHSLSHVMLMELSLIVRYSVNK